MDYRLAEDIELVKELLSLSQRAISRRLDISVMTLNRWAADTNVPTDKSLERFYSFAYKQGLRLNKIKSQLYLEDFNKPTQKVVFHGSKQGLEGLPDLNHARVGNDFGSGFYCGESFEQSALFVARYPHSSAYAFLFEGSGLKATRFKVNRDWMLAVAFYRGKLGEYANHPIIQKIKKRVEASDYVVAPIADNRMFEIIDNFIDGEITDEQCEHCLSATQLGNQYVFKSPSSLERLTMLEHCFLCNPERNDYLDNQLSSAKTGADKVKVARRTYRGQGSYIEELLS